MEQPLGDRKFVTEGLQFDPENLPAIRQHNAQWRAQYWRARVSTLRLFSRAILHLNGSRTASNAPVPTYGNSRSWITVLVIDAKFQKNA
jgi:hypothetical protein